MSWKRKKGETGSTGAIALSGLSQAKAGEKYVIPGNVINAPSHTLIFAMGWQHERVSLTITAWLKSETEFCGIQPRKSLATPLPVPTSNLPANLCRIYFPCKPTRVNHSVCAFTNSLVEQVRNATDVQKISAKWPFVAGNTLFHGIGHHPIKSIVLHFI